MDVGDTSLGGPQGSFPETTLGVFARLGEASTGEEVRAALEILCARYWKPAYRYLRIGLNKSNEEAKDLCQAFFLWLLDGETLKRYAPDRGSFRVYLKTLLKRFAGNEDRALSRLKRGGNVKILSLDGEGISAADVLPDEREVDPERAFDREWRLTVLRRGVGRVRGKYAAEGKAGHFSLYEDLEGDGSSRKPSYADLAEWRGISEGEVRRILFGVREAIRAELRSELGETLGGAAGLEEEWRALFGA